MSSKVRPPSPAANECRVPRGQAQEHPRLKRMRDAIQPSGAGSSKDEIRLLGSLVVAGGGHRSRVKADMPGSQGTLLVAADQRFQMVGAKGAVGREFPRLPDNDAARLFRHVLLPASRARTTPSRP
jgi:hypothetical protein